jgi:hypothetical protein
VITCRDSGFFYGATYRCGSFSFDTAERWPPARRITAGQSGIDVGRDDVGEDYPLVRIARADLVPREALDSRDSFRDMMAGVKPWRACLLIVGLAAGCIEPQLVPCGDLVCPAQTVCSPTSGTCVARSLLDACIGVEPAGECQVSASDIGECVDGLCLVPTCGDGLVSGAEDCEPGVPMTDVTCAELGYYEPEGLACSPTCRFDTTQCRGGICGDRVVDEPEGCDGEPSGGLACVDFGFDSGVASCSASCNAILGECSRHGWKTVEANRSGAVLWVAVDGQVFASGNGIESDFYRFDGTRWHAYNLGPVRAIWGASSSDVFAVGNQGLIKRFDGTSWTLMPSPVPAGLTGVGGNNASDVYAWGATVLLHFDGTAWQVVPTPPTDLTTAAAVTLDGGLLVAGRTFGGTPRLDHYDGSVWQPIPLGSSTTVEKLWAASLSNIYSIERDDPNDVGVVRRFDGNGWSQLFVGQGFSANDVWGLSANDVSIVGRSTLEPVAVSNHFDGIGWQRVIVPEHLEFTAIRGNASELYAGDRSGLAHSERNIWSVPVQLPDIRTELWADSSGSIIVASDANLYRYDGQAWQTLAIPALASTLAVVDYDHLYIGDFFGSGVQSYEEGSGWTNIGGAGSGTGTLTSLLALATDDVYVAHRPFISFGTPIYTVKHYDGLQWQTVLSTSAARVKGLWGMGSHVIAYDATTALHWDGVDWVEHKFPTGTQMNAMWGLRHDDVYAVGTGGSLAHFDGSQWVSLDSNTTSDLVAITGTSATDIYIAGSTLPRTLMHFDGSRWSPIRPRANSSFQSLAIAGRDLVAITAASIVERFRSP